MTIFHDLQPAPARIIVDGGEMPPGADKLIAMALRFIVQPEVFSMFNEYMVSQNTNGPEADHILRAVAPMTRYTMGFLGHCFDLAIQERHPTS